MIRLQKKPASNLTCAYNQIMANMREAFNDYSEEMNLQKALDIARHDIVHRGILTVEEAHEIGEYIKRDVNDAAEYMMEASDEFYDWLSLDIETIERNVMKLFLDVAENTRVELEQFGHSPSSTLTAEDFIPVYSIYQMEEPGIYLCENCGQKKTDRETPDNDHSDEHCSRCGHNYFRRL